MEGFGGTVECLIGQCVRCVVLQSIGLVEVVRHKPDRRVDRVLRLSLGGDRMTTLEVADPIGCSRSLLSAHQCFSRLGHAEVMWVEERCPGTDTVGPKLFGWGQIVGREAVWSDLETDPVVDTEMLGCLNLAEKIVGGLVAVVYEGVVWAAHHTQDKWYLAVFLTGL